MHSISNMFVMVYNVMHVQLTVANKDYLPTFFILPFIWLFSNCA